jgi:hypothetical protein
MITVGTVIARRSGLKSVSVKARWRSSMTGSEQPSTIMRVHHSTIAGETGFAGVPKKAEAPAATRPGRSRARPRRPFSRSARSTPSGLSAVFKVKGVIGATSTRRATREPPPCRAR